MCDPKSLIAPPFLTRTEHICTHHGVVITCGILNGGLLILNERSTELALLMRDTSSMKQRGWPPLERISTFEVMNLDGSEATPGFPGFYVFKSILVCVYVCILRMSQSLICFGFSRSTTCRVNLLVWKEMGILVCWDAMYHSLSSLYFPFLYSLITLLQPWFTVLYVRLKLLLLMFNQRSHSTCSATIS